MLSETSPRSWMRISSRAIFLTILATLVAAFCSAQSARQNPLAPKSKASAPPAQPASAGAHELTSEDLSAFLDGIMPLQLQREDIAGAVIAVVKDGKPLFAKGYGYSDVAKKIPVSTDATLFRPGSVSKLFTWTAVMQLVEEGKIDLDRDVNDYIDFKIPATYPKPITMRNLMTHTPGFEETVQELFLGDTKDLKPLGDYLKAHLPERVYPPGTTPAYSNYGAALAGYIVQRVSGQDFDTYVETHIFNPLGMTRSTFRQPLPDALKPLMSNGYAVASAPAKPFEPIEVGPAGSLSATADDMAHFMIAHLQKGRFDSTQILRPETAELMHSRQFENLPSMNAMCLGFYEESRNGHRIIGHGGDTEYFHSDLHLVLDAGVGFFISYNSAGKGQISPRTATWEAVLDRYFPYQLPATQPVSTAAQDAAEVSGNYIVSRRAVTTIFSALTPLGEDHVSANADGTISVSALKDLNGKPKHFTEIAPLLFRDVNNQDRVGFKRDASGHWIMAIDYPFMVYQKASFLDGSGFNFFILIGGLCVLALVLILWPVAALIRRRYGRKLELTSQQRSLRRLIKIVAAVLLLFVISFVGYIIAGTGNLALLYPKYNPLLRLIQIIGWIGVIGTLVVLYRVLRSWTDRNRWLGARICDTVVVLACLGVVWFAYLWNMLHWSLKY